MCTLVGSQPRHCASHLLTTLSVSQACVSRTSAYSDTVKPGRIICYKSVTNSAGTGCGAQMATTTCMCFSHRPAGELPTFHWPRSMPLTLLRHSIVEILCAQHARRFIGRHVTRCSGACIDHKVSCCVAVKAKARVTPLTARQRPQACLPSGGTSHQLLLATTSQFSLAHLKAISLRSLRLAGATWLRVL